MLVAPQNYKESYATLKTNQQNEGYLNVSLNTLWEICKLLPGKTLSPCHIPVGAQSKKYESTVLYWCTTEKVRGTKGRQKLSFHITIFKFLIN